MMEAKVKSIQRYPEYKDSGEEWIQEIPKTWDVLKLKHLFKEKKISHNVNLPAGSISFGKVIEKDDTKIPKSTKASYQVLSKGEFLVNPLNLNYDLKSLRIGLSKIDVVVSSGYIILQATKQLNKEYFKYFLYRYDVAYMKLLGSGVRQTINFNNIADSLMIFPPLNEQTAIANFLDDKTEKIDRAVSIKEKQIALLKERRQIIIQELVTGKKVWNEAKQAWTKPAKTKDSGVEWIGEIPEEWEVKKLKYVGYLYAGLAGKSGEDFAKHNKEGFKPFVPFTSIFNSYSIKDQNHQYVKINSSENQNKVVENDILFLMSSETLDDIGKSSIYMGGEKELYLNSFCKGLRVVNSDVKAEYLNILFQSFSMRKYFSKKGRGFTRINIKQDFVLSMPILIPHIREQKEIIKRFEDVTQKIDQAISIKEREIEKLKEYKASLINDVVLGKVKVT